MISRLQGFLSPERGQKDRGGGTERGGGREDRRVERVEKETETEREIDDRASASNFSLRRRLQLDPSPALHGLGCETCLST